MNTLLEVTPAPEETVDDNLHYFGYMQRYFHEHNPAASGVSKYLSGDYMGSAEFEFGECPKAWRILRESVSAGTHSAYRVQVADPIKAGKALGYPKVSELYVIQPDGVRVAFKESHLHTWKKECLNYPGSHAKAWLAVRSRGAQGTFVCLDKAVFDLVLAELKGAPVARSTSLTAEEIENIKLFDTVMILAGNSTGICPGIVVAIKEGAFEVVLPDETISIIKHARVTAHINARPESLKSTSEYVRRVRFAFKNKRNLRKSS